MSAISGKSCVRCCQVVGYRKEGEFCSGCRRPIHTECKRAVASSKDSQSCPQCGVSTRCDLCESESNDVVPGFLRLQRTAAGIGSFKTRWVNLQCYNCEECFRKGNRVKWSGMFGLALMFGMPLLLFGAGIPLMELLLGKEGALHEGILGYSEKQLRNGFVLSTLVLTILAFVSGIPLSGVLARRRMKAVYKPALDKKLREIAGVSRWGAFANVSVFRKIPEGESIVSLN